MGTAIAAIGTIGGALISSKASKDASKAATEGTERAQDILKASRDQARSDVLRLFPEAQAAQTAGFENARGFLAGQVLPQQADLYTRGNTAAQKTLLSGNDQVMNALLGNQIDMSGIQPTSMEGPSFDLSGFAKPKEETRITNDQFSAEIQRRLKEAGFNIGVGNNTSPYGGGAGVKYGGDVRNLQWSSI